MALFSNNMADNLGGGAAPFDIDLQTLFVNAASLAPAAHHGNIGEFNGAVMGMASNTAGFPAIGLIPESANHVHRHGPQFTCDVGPIGAGNAIDAGVTFPFTDADRSIFLTDITGASPSNIVDIYTSADISGEPAMLANQVVINGGDGSIPEPGTWFLLATGIVGLLGYRWHQKKQVM